MNKPIISRILLTALLAAAFVLSGLLTVASAMNLPIAAGLMPRLTASGSAAIALCAVAASSTAGAVISAALCLPAGGLWLLINRRGLSAVGSFFALWQGGQAEPGLATLGGQTFFSLAAIALGALFFLLLYRRELTSMAIMILLSMLIAAHAMSESASLAATVPGLMAAAAAFALTGGVSRDGAAIRVLIPSILAVLLALVLLPGGRVTWKPLEEAGERVRGTFEQYFSFTHERIAFSISEEGYNHGGEIEGETVAMLGGPAQPDTEPVMRVTAEDEVLLRGTIRATYTGYSWIDVTPKSRYLYYDLTHRSVRDRVFDQSFEAPGDAFHATEAQVELLSPGTSTLFVPGRLARFSMDLSNAVYYNSSGEMFMAREVAPGDRYALRGLAPVYGDALRQAVIRGEASGDDRFAEILSAHSALAPGIEDALYALTMNITHAAENPYDRAAAIADYLRANMRYSLDVEYPPVGRDFVSWFVLESKTGYCSYFASAMAVMGRIAGLPTRYVEGYLARPDQSGSAVLTGEDAHAWAEVYFRGVGWVPFDATNGTTARNGGAGMGESAQYQPPADDSAYGLPQTGDESQPEVTAPPVPDATPSLTESQTPPDGLDDAPEQTPTPAPEGDPEDSPEDSQDDFPEDSPETPDASDDWPEDGQRPEPKDGRRGPWLVLGLLLLLALIALAVLWVRRRLQRSDPARLCAQVRRAQQAALIAYRANLTLLGHMGQGPVNGETPEVFAARVAQQFNNPDFERFVRAVALSRYGNRPVRREDIQAGLNAYRAFEGHMSRLERARYAAYRVLHGLGSFEAIP